MLYEDIDGLEEMLLDVSNFNNAFLNRDDSRVDHTCYQDTDLFQFLDLT